MAVCGHLCEWWPIEWKVSVHSWHDLSSQTIIDLYLNDDFLFEDKFSDVQIECTRLIIRPNSVHTQYENFRLTRHLSLMIATLPTLLNADIVMNSTLETLLTTIYCNTRFRTMGSRHSRAISPKNTKTCVKKLTARKRLKAWRQPWNRLCTKPFQSTRKPSANLAHRFAPAASIYHKKRREHSNNSMCVPAVRQTLPVSLYSFSLKEKRTQKKLNIRVSLKR